MKNLAVSNDYSIPPVQRAAVDLQNGQTVLVSLSIGPIGRYTRRLFVIQVTRDNRSDVVHYWVVYSNKASETPSWNYLHTPE